MLSVLAAGGWSAFNETGWQVVLRVHVSIKSLSAPKKEATMKE
jgi:hypothetical protein